MTPRIIDLLLVFGLSAEAAIVAALTDLILTG